MCVCDVCVCVHDVMCVHDVACVHVVWCVHGMCNMWHRSTVQEILHTRGYYG